MLRDALCRMVGVLNARRWHRATLQEHDGIQIADESFRKDLQKSFVAMTIEALRLVRRKDPRRYRRIRQYLRFIVHREHHPTAVASYCPYPSACAMDFARFHYGASPRMRTILLAATFVHEATHGRLLRRGIPNFQPRKFHLRMERICLAEEARFAAAVDPRLRDPYRQAMSRAYQRIVAKPRIPLWQRFLGLQRRILESQRKARTSGAGKGRKPIRSVANRKSLPANSPRFSRPDTPQ